jgi:hypothetical protein
MSNEWRQANEIRSTRFPKEKPLIFAYNRNSGIYGGKDVMVFGLGLTPQTFGISED